MGRKAGSWRCCRLIEFTLVTLNVEDLSFSLSLSLPLFESAFSHSLSLIPSLTLSLSYSAL